MTDPDKKRIGVHYLEVTNDEDGQRLDRVLKSHFPDHPFGLLQKLLRTGQIRVDSKRSKTSTRLTAGQRIRIPPMEAKPERIKKRLSEEDIAFMKSLVLYDDGEVIAINKPYDLAVQGGTNTFRHIDGLLDALIDPKDPEKVRPRLVHRLDKDTSGVMLLARTARVARELGKAFKGRGIRKIYWALVSPTPELTDGVIRVPLLKGADGESKHDKERMFVNYEEGKPAHTEYEIIEKAHESAAFLALMPKTGRTHQLRVHAEFLGCPIVGDRKYNNPEGKGMEHIRQSAKMEVELSKRLHLHAHRISLPHPTKDKMLDIIAPLSDDLIQSWKEFGFDPNYDDAHLFEE